MADLDELITEAAAWRKAGNKQSYRYSEDIGTKPDPRCHKCGKTAYKAEIVTYEKIPYHKVCFKCLQCKKKLTPGIANPFGEDTFMCNTHFGQAIKSTGGAGGDAISADSPNINYATGPGLVSGGAAEEVDLSAGYEFRKAGKRQAYNYPEDVSGPDKRTDPRCHKCGKTAYKAEIVTYEKIPYHKNCFKCLQCKKKLTPGEANPWGETTFLCNTHFGQNIRGTASKKGEVFSSSTKGVESPKSPSVISRSAQAEEIDLSVGYEFRKSGQKQVYRYPEDVAGPTKRNDPRCHKCGKTAYKAEIVTYEKIPFHKNCFKCLQCKKKLTPGVSNPWGEDCFLCNTHFLQNVKGTRDGAGGDVYSSSTKGVEMKQGPSIISGGSKEAQADLSAGIKWRKEGGKQVYKFPEDAAGPNKRHDPRCNKCGKTAYKAEILTYEKIPYHKNCFKCFQCKKKMTPAGANPFGPEDYLCNVHFHQIVMGGGEGGGDDVVSASSAEVKQTGPSTVSKASGGFEANAGDMKAAMDFRKSGEKQSYRFPEDVDGPTKKNDPRCQKCGKTAYKAEVVTYERIPYHKKCFRCLECNKRLTPGTSNPLGPDTYMCDTHFKQFVLGGGAESSTETASAGTALVESAGPSSVGGEKKVRKKTTYKPPKRKRRGGRR